MKGKKCRSCEKINPPELNRCTRCNSDIEFEPIEEYEDFVGEGATAEEVESDTKATNDTDPKLSGISGWLLLPAIGFVLGPVIGTISLIAALGLYSEVASAGYGGIYALELIVMVGLLGLTVYAAWLFFTKKREAPRVIIILLFVSIAASGFLLLVELRSGAEVFAVESIKQLIRSSIAAAIWVPYFRSSKRVKATFVD